VIVPLAGFAEASGRSLPSDLVVARLAWSLQLERWHVPMISLIDPAQVVIHYRQAVLLRVVRLIVRVVQLDSSLDRKDRLGPPRKELMAFPWQFREIRRGVDAGGFIFRSKPSGKNKRR
jgi:hypothetical protein